MIKKVEMRIREAQNEKERRAGMLAILLFVSLLILAMFLPDIIGLL